MSTGLSCVVMMPIALVWFKIHQPTFLSSWSTIESKFTTNISVPWAFNFNGITVSKHIKSKTSTKPQNRLTSEGNDNSFSTGSYGSLQISTRHHELTDPLSELWVIFQDFWLEKYLANENLCSGMWESNWVNADKLIIFYIFTRTKNPPEKVLKTTIWLISRPILVILDS